VLDQVTDWLIEFTRPTAVRVRWAERGGVWVDQPLAAYRRMMSPAPAEAEALDRLRATVADWGVRSVPEVTVHWGFRTQNMFLTDRGLSVVDWEGASPGPALYDLFFFLVEWVGLTGTRQRLSSILCGSEASDRRERAVRYAVQRYVDALDLDPAVVPVIYTLLMVECALGRQRRGSAPATPYVAEVRNMLREQSAPSDRVRFCVPP
jgi:aminoglycoside phosphotransferase (APT) family kinase protein